MQPLKIRSKTAPTYSSLFIGISSRKESKSMLKIVPPISGIKNELKALEILNENSPSKQPLNDQVYQHNELTSNDILGKHVEKELDLNHKQKAAIFLLHLMKIKHLQCKYKAFFRLHLNKFIYKDSNSTQIERLRDIIKKLRNEILELHEENSKLTDKVEQSTKEKLPNRKYVRSSNMQIIKRENKIPSRFKSSIFAAAKRSFDLQNHPSSRKLFSGLATEKTINRDNNVGNESVILNGVPAIVDKYFAVFQCIFDKFKEIGQSGSPETSNQDDEGLSIKGWNSLCSQLGFYKHFSVKNGTEIFVKETSSIHATMDMPSFIEALIRVANEIYSDPVKDYTCENQLLKVLDTIIVHFNTYNHSSIDRSNTISQKISSNTRIDSDKYGNNQGFTEPSNPIDKPQLSNLDKDTKLKLYQLFCKNSIALENKLRGMPFMNFVKFLQKRRVVPNLISMGIANMVFQKAFQQGNRNIGVGMVNDNLSYSGFLYALEDLAERKIHSYNRSISRKELKAFLMYILSFQDSHRKP